MTRRHTARIALALLGLALLLGVSACSATGAGVTPEAALYGPNLPAVPLGPPEPPTATLPPQYLQLRILHTNDTSGEVDPCG